MSLVALVIALMAVPAGPGAETAQSVRSTQVVTAAHLLAGCRRRDLGQGRQRGGCAIATAYALASGSRTFNLGGEGYMVISPADGTEVAIDYCSWALLHVNAHACGMGRPPHGILTTLIPAW